MLILLMIISHKIPQTDTATSDKVSKVIYRINIMKIKLCKKYPKKKKLTKKIKKKSIKKFIEIL